MSTSKPEKPYPDFPLTPHSTGRWVKKVNNQSYYFTGSAQEALAEWQQYEDDIRAGTDPRYELIEEPSRGARDRTVSGIVDAFMKSREVQRMKGEAGFLTIDDYDKTCRRMVAILGRKRDFATLGPEDFTSLMLNWPTTWATTTRDAEIQRVTTVCRWAKEANHIPDPINTGPEFRKASKRVHRTERESKPRKEFSAPQIHQILSKCSVPMRAMVLLGVNCGYGPMDCARLRMHHPQLDKQWLSVARGKTGIKRGAWLWPETVEALRVAIRERPYPNLRKNLDLMFVTRRGNPWGREDRRDNAITRQFTEITRELGIYQKHISFYALRHVTETIGGNAKDKVAVDFVMGHVDESTGAIYREGIDDSRVKVVCETIREWFLAGAPDGEEKTNTEG